MDHLLYFEKGKSYQNRKAIGRVFFIWSLLFLSLAVTSLVLELPTGFILSFEILFVLFLAFYITNAIVKAIFLHLYKKRINRKEGYSLEALYAKERGRNHGDDVAGFIDSPYGVQIMKRLGLTRHSLQNYLDDRADELRCEKWHLPHEEIENRVRWIDLQDYAGYLHDHDDNFAGYLRNEKIQRTDLLYAASLIQNISALQKELDRFWSSTKLHDLDSFELLVLQKEEKYGPQLTSQAIRMLASLNEDEKEDMLERILRAARKNKQKIVHVGDIRNLV
jgi:hypothetical protein